VSRSGFPGAVSILVANGFSTIISSQKVLSVRSRESTLVVYQKVMSGTRAGLGIGAVHDRERS
jgi:hypothetical protein